MSKPIAFEWEGATCFLVLAGDAARLSGRVLQLYGDRALAPSTGALGRWAVLNHWSIDSMVQSYEERTEAIYASNSAVRSGRSN